MIVRGGSARNGKAGVDKCEYYGVASLNSELCLFNFHPGALYNKSTTCPKQPPPTPPPPSSRTMSPAAASVNAAQPSGYVCDTLPRPKLASSSGSSQQSRSPSPVPSPTPPATEFRAAALLRPQSQPQASSSSQISSDSTENFSARLAPPGRKLCVRHQRMADENTNLKLQQVSNRSSFFHCLRSGGRSLPLHSTPPKSSGQVR